MIQALLWDVDGTLAETERDGHRVAFNEALASMGLPWRWDEAHYGRLLRVTGGRERLLFDLQQRDGVPPHEREALALELHRRKNVHYAAQVQAAPPPLRPGVRELVDEAAARGLRNAIVSTTGRRNVELLLQAHFGAAWRQRFGIVVCGEDVRAKKPDPEAHRLALQALGLPATATLGLEDAAPGAHAALAAGVPVVVTRSHYFPDDAIDGALAVGPGLHTRSGWQPAPVRAGEGRLTLDDLMAWHRRLSLAQPG